MPGTLVILFGVRLDVASRVELDAERLDQAVALRVQEAHRQQHEVGVDVELAAGDLDHLHAAVLVRLPVQVHGMCSFSTWPLLPEKLLVPTL